MAFGPQADAHDAAVHPAAFSLVSRSFSRRKAARCRRP